MSQKPHPHGETKKQILNKLRIFQIALAVTLGVLLASATALWQIGKDEGRRMEMRSTAMRPPTGSIGGPFTLTNQNGKTVQDSKFRGKYMLVYFGYTYCPDLCPTGLEGIAHTLDQLGSEASKIQPLFITIDPERDTPAKLKEYVASFHSGISALTGTAEQIASVARAYQVYYAKGENVEEGQYLMDHSNLIYVMDPEGKFVTTFPEDTDPSAMAEALRTIWNKKVPTQAM